MCFTQNHNLSESCRSCKKTLSCTDVANPVCLTTKHKTIWVEFVPVELCVTYFVVAMALELFWINLCSFQLGRNDVLK